jgi:hypothetical protein
LIILAVVGKGKRRTDINERRGERGRKDGQSLVRFEKRRLLISRFAVGQ